MPDAPITPQQTNSQTPVPPVPKLGKPNPSIDFRNLANSMVANRQFHLPPNDVTRMGEVVGYDPNYVTDDPTAPAPYYDYPTVSVTLAGDDTPMHGFRFMEHYTPTIGDTVWVQISGEDGFVLGKLSGAYNTVSNAPTGNSPTTLLGHSYATAGQQWQITSAEVDFTIDGITQAVNVLPNRKYRYEINYSIYTLVYPPASGVNHMTVKLQPTLSPNSYGSPVTIDYLNDFTSSTNSSGSPIAAQQRLSGTMTGYWSYSPSAPIIPGEWTTWFPNGQLQLGMIGKLTSLGSTSDDFLGELQITAMDMAIYDCGLAG